MVSSRIPQKFVFWLVAAVTVSFLISFAALQLSVGILFVLYLLEPWNEKKKAFDRISSAILIFGAVRVLTIFTSEHFNLSVESFQREVLFYFSFLAFQFYFKSFSNKRNIDVYKIFIVGGFAVALIGTVLFIFTPIERAQSITSGYHTFADYLVVVLIAALNYKPKEKEIVFWIIGIGAVFSAVIISMGRVSIALAAAAVALFSIINRIKISRLAAIAASALALALISFHFNTAGYVSTRISNPAGLSDRDVLYQGFAEIYSEHPILGFGPRTFRAIFPHLEKFADKNISSWHNDLMQVYIESGALLLIAYLFLVGVIVQTFSRGRKESAGGEFKLYKLGVFGGLIALFLTGLTSSVIFSPTLYLLAAFLIAYLGSIGCSDGSAN